jgi:hypothetical protein
MLDDMAVGLLKTVLPRDYIDCEEGSKNDKDCENYWELLEGGTEE